jgi:HlyD family secretion protein
LYNVEITVKNPGALKEGMKATAELAAGGTTLESTGSGTLSYANSKVIKSNAGGTIKSMNLRENEYVNAGDILAVLENADLMLSVKSDNIKMENLRSQLDIQQKQLEYYTITAPFDGTVTSMGKANEGDTVKQGEVLAVVSDMGHLEFSVDIDELDIAKISVGQKVKITAEALRRRRTHL